MTDKLEEAVRRQADSLDPAQREFVLAQFDHYRWNEEQIVRLQAEYEACADVDGDREQMAMRASLFKERHQLVAEQGQLFSHIMRWLKGTASNEDEFDEFLAGKTSR